MTVRDAIQSTERTQGRRFVRQRLQDMMDWTPQQAEDWIVGNISDPQIQQVARVAWAALKLHRGRDI